jgi:23S rRNA (pseudouridine1915-N3)-methyltransferase
MHVKFLWPGKTRNRALREIEEEYILKIKRMVRTDVLETKEARGLMEKEEEKIKEIETQNIEKNLGDDYIICLSDKGKMMSSKQLAVLMKKTGMHYPYPMAFVVGGFIGLKDRILNRADLQLAMSKMTFSHELTRIMLLEQVYRSLNIIQGNPYAK